MEHSKVPTSKKALVSDVRHSACSGKESLDHGDEKPYICKTCSIAFADEESLNKHVIVHEKRYTCHECKKSFDYEHKLLKHSKLHTGVNKNACNVNPKERKYVSKFKRRSRSYSDESLYVCDECQLDFTERINLIKHLCLHNDEKLYFCPICHQAYIHRQNLNVHLKVHIGEDPYNLI